MPRFPIVRLPRLARRHSRRVVFAVFGAISAAVSIGIIAAAGAFAHQPLVVPSLGPTAFLIFERPRMAAAAPRNVVLGHAMAIVAGEIALFVTGAHGTSTLTELTPRHIFAATMSVSLVMLAMGLTKIPHPPAAATTLIVSLGLLTGLGQLTALGVAVILLATQGIVIDRVAGLSYPAWRPRNRIT